MNSFGFLAFLACLAAANAGYYGPPAQIIAGPSGKTTLVGPEGSVISAVAPGAHIVHEQHPGYVAHAAYAPVVGHETHIAKYGSHVTHGAPAAAVYSVPAYATYAHSPVGAHYGGPYSGFVAAGQSVGAPYHGHELYGGHHHGLYL